MSAKTSKSKGQHRASTSSFRAEWIGWSFWGLCVCVLGLMLVCRMPGAIVPALGTGLAFVLTRSGVTKRLRPYHPAYCVGTAMAIWLLMTLFATGMRELLIDLGLLLLGLGLVSAFPGIISASVLSVILVGNAAFVWSQRGESTPAERSVISVEVALLLLTVAATWAGYIESNLKWIRSQARKKSTGEEQRDE